MNGNDALAGDSLTLQDIAEIACVSKAAVTNWKARMSDFPNPVMGSTKRSPLYSKSEILEWLIVNKKISDSDVASRQSDLAFRRLRSVLKLVESGMSNGLIVGLVATILAAHVEVKEARDALVDDAVLSGILFQRSISEKSVLIAVNECSRIPFKLKQQAYDACTELVQVVSAKEIAEFIVDEHQNTMRYYSGNNYGPRSSRFVELARKIAASFESVGSIYDPTCGGAGALLSIAETDKNAKVFGTDIDGIAVAVAELRANLHGIQLKIYQENIFSVDKFPDLKADIAVAEPPFGVRINPTEVDFRTREATSLDSIPKSKLAEPLVLMDVISHLAEEGWGFVITPTGIVSQSAFKTFRQSLIAKGTVAALIELPPSMVIGTAIRTILWVLRPVQKQSAEVILIDAHEVKSPEQKISDWMKSIFMGECPAGVPAKKVSLAEAIASEKFSWLPSEAMRLSRSATELYDVLKSMDHAGAETMQQLTSVLEALESPVKIAPADSSSSLSGLLKSGVKRIKHAPVKANDAKAPQDIKVGSGEKLVYLYSTRDGFKPVRALAVDKEYETLPPGSLIVQSTGKLSAEIVPSDGKGWVTTSSLTVYEVDESKWNLDFLSMVISSQTNAKSQGSLISQATLKDIMIPAYPQEEQRYLTEQYALRRQAQALSLQLAKQLDSLNEAVIDVAISARSEN